MPPLIKVASLFVRSAKSSPPFIKKTMTTIKPLTDPKALIDKTDVFLLDCDGVLWRGDVAIDGAVDAVEKLRALGKRLFFVTNNSLRSRKGLKGKFNRLGFNVKEEEIFSSSFAAAAYLESINFRDTGKKVYVIGEAGLCEELESIGVPYLGGPEDNRKTVELSPGSALQIDREVGAVVVGLDLGFNYYKIQYAQLAINENNAHFIATSLASVGHLTDVQKWAAAGAMVGAIKACTAKEPVVVGKPSPLMIDYIAHKFGIPRDKICMVGDRLDTDILFGKDNGLTTLLTLSGVTSAEKLMDPHNDIHPDFYIPSIADFL